MPMMVANKVISLPVLQIVPHFHPSLASQVRAGVNNSLRQILDKRVIPHIEPLFDNPRMDHDLRRLLRDTFPDFCSGVTHDDHHTGAGGQGTSAASAVARMDLMAETGLDFGGSGGGGGDGDLVLMNNHHPSVDEDAMFSDEEDEGGSGPSASGFARQSGQKGPCSAARPRTIPDPVVNAPSYSSSSSPNISLLQSTTSSQHMSVTSTIISSIMHPPSNSILSSSIIKPLCSSVSNSNNGNNNTNSNNSNLTSYGSISNLSSNSTKINTNNSSVNSCKGGNSLSVSEDIIEVEARLSGSECMNGDSVEALVNGGRRSSWPAPTALTPDQSTELKTYLDGLETDMKDHLLDFRLEKDQTMR